MARRLGWFGRLCVSGLGLGIGAGAVLPPVRSVGAADLEIGAVAGGGRVQNPANFPWQQAAYGKLLNVTDINAAGRGFREKLDRFAERPLLVLVLPNNVAAMAQNPQGNFRAVWLGNLLHSPDETVTAMLAECDVAVATVSQLSEKLAAPTENAAAYLVATRNGRPHAWTLSALSVAEADFIKAFRPALLEGEDAAKRSDAAFAALTDDERTAATKALKDLGDDSFDVREAATKQLAGGMGKLGPWIRRAWEQSKDPEVRMRCAHLMAEAGRRFRETAPAGCTWEDVNLWGGRMVRKLQPAVNIQLQQLQPLRGAGAAGGKVVDPKVLEEADKAAKERAVKEKEAAAVRDRDAAALQAAKEAAKLRIQPAQGPAPAPGQAPAPDAARVRILRNAAEADRTDEPATGKPRADAGSAPAPVTAPVAPHAVAPAPVAVAKIPTDAPPAPPAQAVLPGQLADGLMQINGGALQVLQVRGRVRLNAVGVGKLVVADNNVVVVQEVVEVPVEVKAEPVKADPAKPAVKPVQPAKPAENAKPAPAGGR